MVLPIVNLVHNSKKERVRMHLVLLEDAIEDIDCLVVGKGLCPFVGMRECADETFDFGTVPRPIDPRMARRM